MRGLQPELISRRMSLCKRVALIFVAPSLRSVQIQVKLAGDSNQILRLPWKMTLQRQQILRLPRKMILMIHDGSSSHETSFTTSGATGSTLQLHQLVCLPRKITCRNISAIFRKRLKRYLQCVDDLRII